MKTINVIMALLTGSILLAADDKPDVIVGSKPDVIVVDNKRPEMTAQVTEPPFAKKRSRKNNKRIPFYFQNEELIDIINVLAAHKGINIVLPTGANAINVKVTLHEEEKLSIDAAWQMLFTILDVAGYSLIPKGETYSIVRTTKEIFREPMPVFVGVNPDLLPDSDQRIRYIYYLSNIKVAEESNSELIAILHDILPDTAVYKADPATNALLISDKSSNIKGLMKIVMAIDQSGTQERPEIVRLRHLDAPLIASLLNEQILRANATDPRMRFDPRRAQEGTYFSRSLRIVAEERTNALIIFGTPQATERIKDFIYKYLDVELETGRSILHVYQLQYLDADRFAEVLQRIVDATRAGGTEQSRVGAGTIGGIERFFDQVIVRSDRPKSGATSATSPEGVENVGSQFYGGNKLIVAARADDWERIRRLIEELDTPQPQVIIEILIADLTLNDIRQLSNQIRNAQALTTCPPQNVNFQSAQADVVVTDVDAAGNPTTVASDLLRQFISTPDGLISIAADQNPGSTIISFNDEDGRTWDVLQFLKRQTTLKVIYNQHVISTNNQIASIVVGESRLLPGDASGSTGGTTTRKKEMISANIKLSITPRISSANSVNLFIDLDIDQFGSTSNTTPNRLTRKVKTSANVESTGLLALGGLTRVDTVESVTYTPILGQIPIIGWLFRGRSSVLTKTNLSVFISPTIIQPRLRGGVSTYTRDYTTLAEQYTTEGMNFENLRDPITRWFFRSSPLSRYYDVTDDVESFIQKDDLTARPRFDSEPIIAKASSILAKNKNVPSLLDGNDRLKELARNSPNPFSRSTERA